MSGASTRPYGTFASTAADDEAPSQEPSCRRADGAQSEGSGGAVNPPPRAPRATSSESTKPASDAHSLAEHRVDVETRESPPPSSEAEPFELHRHPESPQTPLWRKLFFCHFPVRGHASLRGFELRDVWELRQEYTNAWVSSELRGEFDERLKLAAADADAGSSGSSTRALAGALLRAQATHLLRNGLMRAAGVVCSAAVPLVLFDLIDSSALASEHVVGAVHGKLLLLLALLTAERVLKSLLEFEAANIYGRVVSALQTLVFERALVGNGSSAGDDDVQQYQQQQQSGDRLADVMGLYEGDASSAAIAVARLHTLWSDSLLLLAELYLLVKIVHVRFVSTLVALVPFVGVIMCGNSVLGYLEEKLSERSSELFTLIHECFTGIQAIKLHSWEGKVQERIHTARLAESAARQQFALFGGVDEVFHLDFPRLFSVLVFSTMALPSSDSVAAVTPARVFTALMLFERIKSHMSVLIEISSVMTGGWTSIQTLSAYLQPPQSAAETHPSRRSTGTSAAEHNQDADTIVAIERACFTDNSSGSSSSSSESATVLLVNVNVRIRRGHLTVIRGKTGTGKSTLLRSMLKEVRPLYGDVFVRDDCRVAYCPQEPWLQTLSIRDNILFGSAYDEHKYRCVLDACCLLDDLKMLPGGDATPVGPKGVNLSGGQKGRIALARACYADAELYVLDCPFASVDAIVQSDVFRKCIVDLLRYKTVVLVTHNPEMISSEFVDQVVTLGDRKVDSSLSDDSSKARSASRRACDRHERPPWKQATKADPPTIRRHGLSLRTISKSATEAFSCTVRQRKSSKDASAGISEVLADTVSLETVRAYLLHRDTMRLLSLALLAFLVSGGLASAGDLWLSEWSSEVRPASSEAAAPTTTRGYSFLVLASLVSEIVGGVLTSRAFFRASARFFHRMTNSLLLAPMSFFYAAPIGEILHRYFHDMGTLDVELPDYMGLFLRSTASLLASAVVAMYFMGTLAGAGMVLVLYAALRETHQMFVYLQYTKLRFDSLASNMNFLAEAIDGASIVRGLGSRHVDRFVEAHGEILDELMRGSYFNAAYTTYVEVRWSRVFAMLTLLMGCAVSTNALTPSVFGLVLHLLFKIEKDLTGVMAGLVNETASFLSVERVRAFGLIESECEAHTLKPVHLPRGWPQHGHVVFSQVCFGYSSDRYNDDALALQDVSFSVTGGQKIGVVGRTGSGKSSLAMALFRLHPLTRGQIQIDGINICRLSLRELRRSMTIVPPTPIFYRCSVRHYLDPFDESNDGELWSTIHKCGLQTSVNSLDAELLDNGENWSLGERQMLCLARALLKPSRLLILDESFSALDQASEARLLAVFEESFARSTVFLITHRLDQVLKFDKIMVLEKGELAEFGSAVELASDPSSAFYEFLETTLLTF